MSLASERREAELERANYEKAVQAMRASGGTFSGGSQPGTFTMGGKTIVGDPGSGIYDEASLKKAAKQAALTGQTGVEVSVNGQQMMYYDPSIRNNPGITWKNGDQAGGFADVLAMREAHPKSDDWVKSYGPAIVGGIAGLGALAGPALGGGELLSGMDLAADAAVGSGNYIGGGAVTGGLDVGAGASQLIDGSAQTIYDAAANAGIPGYDTALTSGVAAGGGAGSTLGGAVTGGGALSTVGNALSNLAPSGNAPTLGQLLGGVITGAGGALAADSMGDAYRDVANQYLALGAPSRARFEGSFAPGFMPPELNMALDTAANTSARALSTRFGNPADSPTAQAEMNKYLMGNFILPQLNTYRSQNLTGGQLGTNIAGTGSMAGAASQGGGWEAIGAGANQIFNPQPSLGSLFNQFSGNYGLNIGGMTQR